jgi:DNA helicase II / ATP-dependent DNA helicase PcrA
MDEHTPEQQAIIAHDEGPALVFAVAGSGKTRAMVHRIARLVDEGIFTPKQILATSFNKDANREISQRLQPWPACREVRVQTLHALGFQIIREAIRLGKFPPLNEDPTKSDIDGADRRLLFKAQREARQRKLGWQDEMRGMDTDDFLNYVAQSKGRLIYADLNQAKLPEGTRGTASQAKAPPSLWWYDKLYQLYEELRRVEQIITFDDMLMSGWELLVRHREIRERFQARYRCVMVDEFQDVNKAQAEILDILTEPHRNFMVIGDDDQTIYEWRGAQPAFILDFSKKYGAAEYVMTRNFRCPAEAVSLAKKVIQFNRLRRPKDMVAHKAANQQTDVREYEEAGDMAADMVRRILRNKEEGKNWNDSAVLIRMYAQTPVIEQAFILNRIPYRVYGSQPFYLRMEAMVLLNYLTLAEADAAIDAGQMLDDQQIHKACAAWMRIYHQPKRYLSRDFAEGIAQQYERQEQTLTRLIQIGMGRLKPFVMDAARDLIADLKWLRSNWEQPDLAALLAELEQRIGLKEHYRDQVGVEAGDEKAANVDAIIQYAAGKGDFHAFRGHIQELQEERLRANRENRAAVCITSIFRAKGLEWPSVFVPQVNKEVYPPSRSINDEEERRLLYVAFTRPTEALTIYCAKDQTSRFLTEALKKKRRRMDRG